MSPAIQRFLEIFGSEDRALAMYQAGTVYLDGPEDARMTHVPQADNLGNPLPELVLPRPTIEEMIAWDAELEEIGNRTEADLNNIRNVRRAAMAVFIAAYNAPPEE